VPLRNKSIEKGSERKREEKEEKGKR